LFVRPALRSCAELRKLRSDKLFVASTSGTNTKVGGSCHRARHGCDITDTHGFATAMLDVQTKMLRPA